MSGFRPFLDSNLGAAFFFSSVSMACGFPQLFQAVLVYFRQSVPSLTNLLSPCHTGKIYCQQHHPQISVNSSPAKALALVPLMQHCSEQH
jgi:hypothetical protein